MKKIPLTKGRVAIVDDDDFELLTKFSWWCQKGGNTFYARTSVGGRKNRRNIYMHRLLVGESEAGVVDHKDSNGLNNSRSNLRICDMSKNIAASRLSKANTTGFKGVSFNKLNNNFRASIRVNRKDINVGSFEDVVSAAVAYDSALVHHFGTFARTNASLGLL